MKTRILHRLTVCLSIVFCWLLVTDLVVQAEYATREDRRERVPVGKLMQNLERPENIARKKPDQVIELFGVKQGEVVADIGAGTGTFTFRLADKVGITGKVYAVEIEDALLAFINEKKKKNNVDNIITVKSSDSSPNIPEKSCDKLLIVNTFEYLEDPVAFMSVARRALKPGGSAALVFIDKSRINKKSKSPDIRVYSADEVIDKMKRSGFKFREAYNIFTNRCFFIFDLD